MSDRLDPRVLFDLLFSHIPADLRPNILIVGSLAAAYHHRLEIEDDKINTKDVDVVIQPAGAIAECRVVAERLLQDGWRRVTSPPRCECSPRSAPAPVRDLRIVRLHPPTSKLYFVELLAFPEVGQREAVKWIPLPLADGWYCLPSHRFLGLTAHDTQKSENGLSYASPSMMALANLLSHPTLGDHRIELDGREIPRFAKDLGRVLALARLAGRDETETWTTRWAAALRAAFPSEYQTLSVSVGRGLRALLEEPEFLEAARYAVDVGLLAGFRVTTSQLQAIARQLLTDTIEPLAKQFGRA